MPDKYSVEYDIPFENLIAYHTRSHEIKNQQSANEVYGLVEPKVKADVKYITGNYLIMLKRKRS